MVNVIGVRFQNAGKLYFFDIIVLYKVNGIFIIFFAILLIDFFGLIFFFSKDICSQSYPRLEILLNKAKACKFPP